MSLPWASKTFSRTQAQQSYTYVTKNISPMSKTTADANAREDANAKRGRECKRVENVPSGLCVTERVLNILASLKMCPFVPQTRTKEIILQLFLALKLSFLHMSRNAVQTIP